MTRVLIASSLLFGAVTVTVLSFHSPPQAIRCGNRRRIAPPFDTNTVVNTELLENQAPSWARAVDELERLERIAKQDAAAAGVITAASAEAALPPLQMANVPMPYFEGGKIRNDEKVNGGGRFRSLPRNATRRLTSLEGGDLVCRVIARSDGKLPSSQEELPEILFRAPYLLRRLDDIYHAQAHDETRLLKYMQRPSRDATDDITSDDEPDAVSDAEEEKDLVATVRTSLEDAGFELLTRRDLDLCEALNAGYLLRLSILPDGSKLDPSIAKEFYPEHIDSTGDVLDPNILSQKLLFDGRVLVFWRGYSKEVTKGRLLLPKLDYLQASLVQKLFGSVRNRLDRLERYATINSLAVYRKATACFLFYMRHLADSVPDKRISKRLRQMMRSPYFYSAYKVLNNGTVPSVSVMRAATAARSKTFKLSRYGGSKVKFVGSPNPIDALNPFIICEENGGDDSCSSIPSNILRAQRVDRDMYESLNCNELRCPYDLKETNNDLPSMQLLERVSISNLVDIFTKEGRRNLIKTMFTKSELVEPTYEEVVVVWRPLPETKVARTEPFFKPPKIAYELADMFDFEGLPALPNEPQVPAVSPLEIRTFEGVPMANCLAVLPKTKLVFRPADAFVFDMVSIFSFLAIAGSLKLDNPKLDLIALVSVVLWVIRTVIRYSNKFARYDLLVKKFLTSKISHRNAGALKYLTTEAGSQRATRAALIHAWLTDKLSARDQPLVRSQLITRGKIEICGMINTLKDTPVDVDAALNDLEDLGLVTSSDAEGRLLEVVREDSGAVRVLKRSWEALFDGKGSLKSLIGRRNSGIITREPS